MFFSMLFNFILSLSDLAEQCEYEDKVERGEIG